MAAASTFPAERIAGQPVGEFVRQLTDEQKDAVLAALLQEAIRLTGGTGLIPLKTPGGEPLGYFVPPAATSQLKLVPPTLTPEQQETTRRALADLDDTFDVHGFLSQPDREDPRG